jgi:predicted nucleic acid-binding protein
MSAELFALDSNILIYVVDDDAAEKQDRAREVFRRAVVSKRCVLSVQNVGEFYTVAIRKNLVTPQESARVAAQLLKIFAIVGPNASDVEVALDQSRAGRFSYWDGLLLATVGRVGCATLLSEDMQDGAVLAGVTVRNPFVGADLPPEIAAMLG